MKGIAAIVTFLLAIAAGVGEGVETWDVGWAPGQTISGANGWQQFVAWYGNPQPDNRISAAGQGVGGTLACQGGGAVAAAINADDVANGVYSLRAALRMVGIAAGARMVIGDDSIVNARSKGGRRT